MSRYRIDKAAEEGARIAASPARRRCAVIVSARCSAQRERAQACANLRSLCGKEHQAATARAIGSAGERLVHTEEVTGSIPVSPTDAISRRSAAPQPASAARQAELLRPRASLLPGVILRN